MKIKEEIRQISINSLKNLLMSYVYEELDNKKYNSSSKKILQDAKEAIEEELK